jgi:hypothetical protein
VGSASDVSRIPHDAHVNQWVQSTWNLNRNYTDEGLHVELPGSSSFDEHSFSGTTSVTLEGHDDDVSSFFRAWREGQTERREQDAELGQ